LSFHPKHVHLSLEGATLVILLRRNEDEPNADGAGGPRALEGVMRVQLVVGQRPTQIVSLLIRVCIDVDHLIKCEAQHRSLRATPVLLVEVKATVAVPYKDTPVEAGGEVDARELDVAAAMLPSLSKRESVSETTITNRAGASQARLGAAGTLASPAKRPLVFFNEII
jgi:hypothetical protein